MKMDPRRILVVTDIDLSGWALRQVLTKAGFVVLSAADVDAARAVIGTTEPFDALVVSLSLGTERVSRLLDEAASLWPGALAIVLAIDPQPTRLETGAAHVLLEKPYSMESVVDLIRQAVGAPDTPRADWSGPFAGLSSDGFRDTR
jgi:DNA-binding NtrC family response regulator